VCVGGGGGFHLNKLWPTSSALKIVVNRGIAERHKVQAGLHDAALQLEAHPPSSIALCSGLGISRGATLRRFGRDLRQWGG